MSFDFKSRLDKGSGFFTKRYNEQVWDIFDNLFDRMNYLERKNQRLQTSFESLIELLGFKISKGVVVKENDNEYCDCDNLIFCLGNCAYSREKNTINNELQPVTQKEFQLLLDKLDLQIEEQPAKDAKKVVKQKPKKRKKSKKK